MFTQAMRLGLLISLLSSPSLVWAWGAEGHQTVCLIAYQHLSDSARNQVDFLMGHESDPRYNTYAKACTWADAQQSLPEQNRHEHYINVPRETQRIENANCKTANGCLFSAIERDSTQLADTQKSAPERLQALKRLSHWIGDIHQPLHVAFADDQGGNHIQLTKTIGCNKALHAVWDTCIPRYAMNQNGLSEDVDSFALLLGQVISETQRQQWQDSSPVQWANESYQLAIQAQTRYCTQVGDTCQYSPTQVIWQPGEPERQLNLTEAYNAEFSGVVELRLQQGGIRLAQRLNQLLQ